MTFGKDLAYKEQIPEVGKEFTLYAMPMPQLGNKVNVSPSIRYARLKNLENNLDYFNGYISRFSVRYQFNNFLNIRLVS
ncbi:Lrp/AsnC family transcriptional regulator [bacterium]|nr:Lrp/AsnC family transcriptional regulator [bacterium]